MHPSAVFDGPRTLNYLLAVDAGLGRIGVSITPLCPRCPHQVLTLRLRGAGLVAHRPSINSATLQESVEDIQSPTSARRRDLSESRRCACDIASRLQTYMTIVTNNRYTVCAVLLHVLTAMRQSTK